MAMPAEPVRARPADLDELDLLLIEHLQRDGRMPFAELARRVRVTEKTVRRRVSRLLEENFVTIAAVTDPALLGYGAMALALLTTDGSRSPAQLADELARLPETDYVTVTAGPFPVQVELICTDVRELHDVAFGRIAALAGVASVELLPYLRLHYQQARFGGPRDARDGVRPRRLDETDRAIISRLAVAGRAPFRDFAAELGVSETTIRFRYSRMVASGAARVMCIANPLRLGYACTGWVAVRVGTGRAEQVAEALTRIEAVSYVALTAGRWDVLAEVVCRDGEQLLAVVDGRIRGIDGVAELQSWLYIAVHYKPVRPRRTPPGSPAAQILSS